jgi:hypothetical protein
VLTGIGAPTAWPFFQQRGGRLRVPLGTNIGGGAPTLTIAGVNLAVGDLLLVGTCSDLPGTAGLVTVDIDGTPLITDASQPDTGLLILVTLNRLVIAAPVVAGTITATWGPGNPNNAVMLASKISGTPGAFQERKTAGFGLTTAPDSGLTAVYASAGFHWGLIGTAGRAADTLGNWQNSMTAGQRAATVAVRCDLKEGYRAPAAAVAARAQITGQTSRRSAALVAYYS